MNDIFASLDKLGAETGEGLRRFLDNEEMYLKYIRNFPDEPSMASLCLAVEKGDYAAAEAAVHALKGIVSNLGFTPLTDAAVDMLEELRADNIDDALDAFDDVKKQYSRFCGVIGAWRAEA